MKCMHIPSTSPANISILKYKWVYMVRSSVSDRLWLRYVVTGNYFLIEFWNYSERQRIPLIKAISGRLL